MTGRFQIKKQLDGGSQELVEVKAYSTDIGVNDPVTLVDGQATLYASGDTLFGINNSQLVAPEFYGADEITNIATDGCVILVNPVKDNTFIEVTTTPALTADIDDLATLEATLEGLLFSSFDFNVDLVLVNNVAGTDATIVDFNRYYAKDGSVSVNPIVKINDTAY